MPRYRKDFIERAKEKGSGRDTGIVNNDRLLSKLEPGTERNHETHYRAWEEYVQRKDPSASAYNLESLKDFMRERAYGIDGTKGLAASVETVRNYWNNFTGAWKRRHPAIPSDIVSSVTNFIYGPLKDELGLLPEKKPRRYANKNHLHCYAEQWWARDFYVYRKPSVRVNDWGLFLSNVFHTARIGEYIESTARRNSDRGLYYRDVMFICFWNESKKPELAIQLTKDAKNMSNEPISKRPTHALAEGNEPHLLCFNALLPFLSHLLEINAFRDYTTIQELLAVEPPESVRASHIHWKGALQDTPFFLSQSDIRKGRVETADAYGDRNTKLGVRAGFYDPPTQHDWRAEGLFESDKYYSEATRMRQAGHNDSGTYRRYYQPSSSGIDGQGTFLGEKRRDIVSDVFRELSIPYNPNLSQRLPAKKQYELERSEDFLAVEKKMANLRDNEDPESTVRLKQLQYKRNKLRETALQQWWKEQPYIPDAQPEYQRGIFDRVRFMMPERDRLAKKLFQVGVLRSALGLSVLSDMRELQKQQSEVPFRPGLEPDKCCCSRKKEYDQYDSGEPSTRYDWKHIYDCYKKDRGSVHGFADLCFLCNKWVFGKQEWSDHCHEHVDVLGAFPIYFDHLVYGGVLASPGYCPYCLRNENLEPHDRMHQFLHRTKWLEHIQRHLEVLRKSERQNGKRPVQCPHSEPRCPKTFDCVLELEFHLQDIHDVDMPKQPKPRKRLREASKESRPAPKRQCRKYKREEPEDRFVNTTTKTMEMRSKRISATTSNRSSPHSDSSSVTWGDGRSRTASTALSSISGDTLVDVPSQPRGEEIPYLTFDTTDGPEFAPEFADNSKMFPRHISSTATSEGVNCIEGVSSDQLQKGSSLNETTAVDTTITGGIPEQICSDTDATQNPSPRSANLGHNEHASGGSKSCPAKRNAENKPVAESGDVYEVETVVAKGRIGKRVWYKVKWEGYPESENTWVKNQDVGLQAIATYKVKDPHGRSVYEFERLVAKKKVGEAVCYEAAWKEQPATENFWVEETDLAARLIAAFETGQTKVGV